MKIDHRSLLVRYIRHVTECEGTNYICRIGERVPDVKFTDEEVAELKALEKDGEMETEAMRATVERNNIAKRT